MTSSWHQNTWGLRHIISWLAHVDLNSLAATIIQIRTYIFINNSAKYIYSYGQYMHSFVSLQSLGFSFPCFKFFVVKPWIIIQWCWCISFYIYFLCFIWKKKGKYNPIKTTVFTNSFSMVTSSNGNIFRVTGPLCGEFTGHRWIPRTKASDADFDVFFHLRLNKRVGKQWWGWWFETLSRQYGVIVMN